MSDAEDREEKIRVAMGMGISRRMAEKLVDADAHAAQVGAKGMREASRGWRASAHAAALATLTKSHRYEDDIRAAVAQGIPRGLAERIADEVGASQPDNSRKWLRTEAFREAKAMIDCARKLKLPPSAALDAWAAGHRCVADARPFMAGRSGALGPQAAWASLANQIYRRERAPQ